MTRRAPDSSGVKQFSCYYILNNITPIDKLWNGFRFTMVIIVTPTWDVPFSANHISESKISAHFPTMVL